MLRRTYKREYEIVLVDDRMQAAVEESCTGLIGVDNCCL